VAAVAIGVGALVIGALPGSPDAWLLLIPGVAGAAGTAALRRPGLATLAGCVVVAEVTLNRPSILLLAAETLLLLAYLVCCDAGETLAATRQVLARWLRGQLPRVAAGLALAAAALAAGEWGPVGSVLLILAGTAAAAGALIVGLRPEDRRRL
jgi:hypothetical protein